MPFGIVEQGAMSVKACTMLDKDSIIGAEAVGYDVEREDCKVCRSVQTVEASNCKSVVSIICCVVLGRACQRGTQAASYRHMGSRVSIVLFHKFL